MANEGNTTMRLRALCLLIAVALATAACASDEPGAGSSGGTEGRSRATFSGKVTVDRDGRLVPATCEGKSVASEPDGVTATSVNVATLSIDFKALAKIGFTITGRDPTSTFGVFVDALNEKAGVCGRKIALQKIVYDILQGKGGQACVEATEDRTNLVLNTASYDQILCVTDAGVPAYAGTDVTAADLDRAGGLLFARSPLLEDQYRATVQYAMRSGALEGKVGVWYGNIFPNQGDAVEDVVLPMLDDAGVDYTSYRTDSEGPSDPQGNAALTSAATNLVAGKVDTMLMFVGPTNYTGMQSELHAQGLDPHYISAPIAGNTSNELFADKFGTRAFTDGQEFITYSVGPNELDPGDAVADACNKQWTELTGEKVEPRTFDYVLVTSECVQVDELVAALSLAGGELTRDRIVDALEALPAHRSPGLLGDLDWTAAARGGPAEFSVQVYDSATNSVSTKTDHFTVKG
jgi:hypothetical protein